MAVVKKTKDVVEFGDFQTPNDLALQVISLLKKLGIKAESIVEPTCGQGSLLINAAKLYPYARKYIGLDININHLERLRDKLKIEALEVDIDLHHADFFNVDWDKVISKIPEPILIVGNPPWVTNSDIGALEGSNLPEKSNFHRRNGLDAIMGKSNFDISEWMLLQYLKWLEGRAGVIAVLCKSTVARKTLLHIWRGDINAEFAYIYKIDAKLYFNANVDACIFILGMYGSKPLSTCSVYENIDAIKPSSELGYRDGFVLSDVITYNAYKRIIGKDEYYTWRSGIKHDCSKIMELSREDDFYVNGNNERFFLEDAIVYPLLKSSDVGNGNVYGRGKYIIVTQKYIGEDTGIVKRTYPMAWKYLEDHREYFAKRASSIYRNRPEYSIFGVGDYSFAPWKIAISGFYKRLNFVLVLPIDNKPVMFDDTVYFLPCYSEREARFIFEMINSEVAKNVLMSFIFWEDKRPITIDVLKRLNLRALARELGVEKAFLELMTDKGKPSYAAQTTQMRMFEQGKSYQ